MVFTASLIGEEKKRDSSLVASWEKTLLENSPSLCGRQEVESSSLPIVVAQSDLQGDMQGEHELTRINEFNAFIVELTK